MFMNFLQDKENGYESTVQNLKIKYGIKPDNELYDILNFLQLCIEEDPETLNRYELEINVIKEIIECRMNVNGFNEENIKSPIIGAQHKDKLNEKRQQANAMINEKVPNEEFLKSAKPITKLQKEPKVSPIIVHRKLTYEAKRLNRKEMLMAQYKHKSRSALYSDIEQLEIMLADENRTIIDRRYSP